MKKAVMKILLELFLVCGVITFGVLLLEEFVWWIVRNHYGKEFTIVSATLSGGLLLVWFHHFYLHDGELLFNEKNKEEEKQL